MSSADPLATGQLYDFSQSDTSVEVDINFMQAQPFLGQSPPL